MTPPPKMTQGVMTPLTPPSSPFNSILERVVKSVRIASLFSLFSFAIFLDSTKRIFPDSGVPFTGFNCWLCYFRYFAVERSPRPPVPANARSRASRTSRSVTDCGRPRRGHDRASGRLHGRVHRARWSRKVVAAEHRCRRAADAIRKRLRPRWRHEGFGASGRDLPPHRLHAARIGQEPLSRTSASARTSSSLAACSDNPVRTGLENLRRF